MKVEKHGKFYKKTYNFPIRFNCKLCGCRFVAGASEYERIYFPVPPEIAPCISNDFKRIGYSATCPECGFDVTVKDKEAEFIGLKEK